jgi:hypothetical protein
MYSSYKSLFKIQWKLYAIGDKPLPRAIPLDVIGIFIIMLPFGALLAKPLAQILDQPYFGVMILFTAALTYLFAKFDPQGRPFVVFVLDFIVFLTSPKKRDFTFSSVPARRKFKIYWDTMVLE